MVSPRLPILARVSTEPVWISPVAVALNLRPFKTTTGSEKLLKDYEPFDEKHLNRTYMLALNRRSSSDDSGARA